MVAFTHRKDSRTMLQITSHQGTIRSTGADRYPSIRRRFLDKCKGGTAVPMAGEVHLFL